MTAAPSNGDLVRAAYEHWEKTLGLDPEPFFALVADDFTMASVLDPPDLHELAKDHYGLDRVRDYFAALQHNWLLKRWNLPEAQANLYFGLGAGAAKQDGESFAPAGLGFFRADYETRRIYTAFESKLIGSEDVSRGVTSLSFGVAPYKAEFEELNTWLIVQLEHVSGMEDDLDVIPKIRLFKGPYFLELGCSLDGDPLVNFMIHF